MFLAIRIVAVMGAVIGVAAYGFFSDGFRGNAQLLLIWVAAPFLLGYVAARRVTRHPASARLALAGLLLAVVCGGSLYALAAYSERYDGQSLAGLWVIFAPFVQFGILGAFFAAALVLDRAAARRQRPAHGASTLR